jgi:hypothetical protein
MEDAMKKVTIGTGFNKSDIKPTELRRKLEAIAAPLQVEVNRVFAPANGDSLYRVTVQAPSRPALRSFIIEIETLADGEVPDTASVDDLVNYLYSGV